MSELRFIDFGRVDVRWMMAANEALFRTAEKTGEAVGFTWTTGKAIILGYSQMTEKELSIPRCEEMGYTVTRRISGGGIAFSSERSQIQYGYVGRLEDLPYDVTESYKVVCGLVIEALREFGLPGEFKPINDVLCNGKKISGSAQTRGEKMLLQHGTLLSDLDIKEMLLCCNIPLEKISDKGIATVEERVTDLKRQLGREIPLDDVNSALKKGFERNFDANLKEDRLTEEERRLADSFLPKYYRKDWIFRHTMGCRRRSAGTYPESAEVKELGR